MEYIKREEPPPQLYPTITEPLSHNVVYQNQQLPLNIVEQIQLAVQSGMASTITDAQLQNALLKNSLEHNHIQILPSDSRKVPLMIKQDHRSTPTLMQSVQEHSSTPMIQGVQGRSTPNVQGGPEVALGDHRIQLQDRMIQTNGSQAHSQDRIIQSAMPQTHSHDRITQSTLPQTHSHDRITQSTMPQTHSHDRIIQSTLPQTHSHDRIIQSGMPQAHSHDRTVQNQGHRTEDLHREDHRDQMQMMQNRVMTTISVPEAQRIGLGDHGLLPMPFQIKSEQDPEDNPYFYDQIIQAYSSNGNIQMDHASTNLVTAHQDSHTLQYIFNGHITNINLPNIAAIDSLVSADSPAAVEPLTPYGRQQSFFQNYATEAEGNAENLVVHRQYDNINYATDDMKRERSELIDKIHQSINAGNQPNENIKPKNCYYDPTECYAGKSENDASVQNKIPMNPDDVAYRSLIEAEYANIKGEYICVKCNGIFPSKRGLKQHSKSCPEENGEATEKVGKFSCNQCQYKCQSPAILKIHERTHTGEKPFSCNFCDYKSGQKNNVAKHILVHMKEKPFRCQYCDYRCAQKNNLVVHERTHTGFKPFACTLCDYKTVQKPNLVKHMYLHTGQKPFSCDVCSYKCVQKTNLTKHKMRHLNEKTGEKSDYVNKNANRPYRPRQKTFKCDYCPFRYVQKTGLDKHMQFKHGNDKVDSDQIANEGEYILSDSDAQIQGLNLMKHAELSMDGKGVENLCLRKNEIYAEQIVSEEQTVQIPT